MSVERAVRIMKLVLPDYAVRYEEEFPDTAFIHFDDMPEEGTNPRVDAAMKRITFDIADKGFLLTGVKEDIKESKTMKNFIEIIQENSDSDHNLASDAHKMALLCKELETVVKKMYDVYDMNDGLNEIQPKGFEKIIPMSLDDWYHEIGSVIEDWNDISKNQPTGE